MSIEAWFVGNDMEISIDPVDAAGTAIEGATAVVTVQHPDESAVTIDPDAGFTWPLDMPESPAGTYSVVVDRLALDLSEGDNIRIVVDVDDGAGGHGQWVRSARVVERTGT